MIASISLRAGDLQPVLKSPVIDAAALVAPLKIPLTAREPRIAPWLVPAHAETMQIPAMIFRDSEDYLL